MSDYIRGNIEHYKMALRRGDLYVSGDRRTGRTQAILEYAHEVMHEGKSVTIECGNKRLADYTKARWIESFGKECPMPRFVSPDNRNMEGRNDLLLSDPL